MTIQKWCSSYLKETDAEKIRQAVLAAESTTAGEIVPMIVQRSSTVGHIPLLLLSLTVAVYYVAGGPAFSQQLFGDHLWVYFLDMTLLLALTVLGSRSPFIQRLLTPLADQSSQVEARAIIEFYESNIQKTKGDTGILIMVSLLEHRAVVLADKAINDKVSKDTWEKVCNELVVGIKSRDLGDAMTHAVESCGRIMTPHFPIQHDDTNELKNNLVVKE
jgi:putative membrane protein